MRPVFSLILLALVAMHPAYSQEAAEDVVEETAEEAAESSYWEKAKQTYEEVRSGDRDIKKEATEWVKRDYESMGDWEYKVAEVPADQSADALETALNELGAEHWECFWAGLRGEQFVMMFKKRKGSYIEKVVP